MEKYLYYYIQLLLFVLLLAGSPAMAQLDNTIANDGDVRTGTLPNGLTYYIRKNTEPQKRAVFYLVNKVGSILEEPNQRGLAHFIEHMGFDGTVNYPKNQLIDYLQKAGVRFGADVNAYTSFDQTVYQLPIPTDDPEVVKNGVQILYDWAQGALLIPADIERERGVVLEEKRLRMGASQRVNDQTYPIIFKNSRYGDRLPIGTDDVLNNVKPEELQKFYHDWYRPDLQALIAVGDFDAGAMEKLVKQKFSALKNPPHERPRETYMVPVGTGNIAIITDKEYTATTAELLFKHGRQKLATEGDYVNYITCSLFNIMIQNRFRELNKQTGNQFTNAQGVIANYPGDMEALRLSVTANPGQLESGLKAVWRENIRAIKYGFTQAEFKRAVNIFHSSKYYGVKLKDKATSLSYVNRYMQNFLNGDAIPDQDTELKLAEYYLPRLNFNSINNIWQQYTTKGSRDIIIAAPEAEKARLPDTATVKKWIVDVVNENIQPYTDSVVSQAPIMAKVKDKAKVTQRQVFDKVDVTELTLSNGVKVILKPTDFGNQNIVFSGFATGGTSVYSNADFPNAVAALPVVTGAGVGDMNSIQLLKLLENKSVTVTPYIGAHTQGINGACFPQTLEMALQLTNLYFTQPRKDSTSFNDYIKKYNLNRKTRIVTPNTIYADTLNKILRTVRYGTPGIKSVTLDKAYQIYKERFADAANFTFVFAGKLNVREMTDLAEKYLGTLPSTYQHEQAKDTKDYIADGIIKKTVYAGTDSKAVVTLFIWGMYDFTSQNNTQFNGLREVLRIKLLERLRLQESGIYSANVNVQVSKMPEQRYNFAINFTCAPEHVDLLIADALDEVNKIKNNGPEEVDIEKYKSGYSHNLETQLKSNAFWLTYITAQYENQFDINEVLNYKGMLEKVTKASLKDFAARYLSGNNFAQVVLMPEAFKSEKAAIHQ
jgi:zinc protease